jgi:hypothetical protein
MRSGRALRVAAPIVLVVVIVEAVVSLAERWPHRVGGVGNPRHMMGDFVTPGTALAPPLSALVLLAVLCVGLQAGPRLRLWSTVLMVPLSVVMVVGALGELLATNPPVPAAVRWGAGVVAVGLSALLLVLAVVSLVAAWARRHVQVLA